MVVNEQETSGKLEFFFNKPETQKSFLVASHHVFNFLNIRFSIVFCSCLFLAVKFLKSKGIDHKSKVPVAWKENTLASVFSTISKSLPGFSPLLCTGLIQLQGLWRPSLLKQHEDFSPLQWIFVDVFLYHSLMSKVQLTVQLTGLSF